MSSCNAPTNLYRERKEPSVWDCIQLEECKIHMEGFYRNTLVNIPWTVNVTCKGHNCGILSSFKDGCTMHTVFQSRTNGIYCSVAIGSGLHYWLEVRDRVVTRTWFDSKMDHLFVSWDTLCVCRGSRTQLHRTAVQYGTLIIAQKLEVVINRNGNSCQLGEVWRGTWIRCYNVHASLILQYRRR